MSKAVSSAAKSRRIAPVSCVPKPETPDRIRGADSLLRAECLFAFGPALDHLDESRGVIDIFLARPFPIARVLQDRDVRALVDASVSGVLHPVQDLADDPAALFVDDVPGGGERIHLVPRELSHRPGDPRTDLVAAVERPKVMLDVRRVFSE